METQNWLSCHNKFISAENIIIHPVSSLYMLYLRLWNSKCGITIHMCTMEKKSTPKNNPHPLSSDTDWILQIYIYIYIYIYIVIIIMSYASMDLSHSSLSLSPFISIIHRFRQVSR